MASNPKPSTGKTKANHHSPLDGLVYRALVFARDNGETGLYFVAGQNGGPWAPAKALAASHKLHGGNCFYCKKSVAKGKATVDHVEPQCLGGGSNLLNLVIACDPCNKGKGHKVIDAYNPAAGKEWLQAVLQQVQQRLADLSPSSPPRPSRAAEAGP